MDVVFIIIGFLAGSIIVWLLLKSQKFVLVQNERNEKERALGQLEEFESKYSELRTEFERLNTIHMELVSESAKNQQMSLRVPELENKLLNRENRIEELVNEKNILEIDYNKLKKELEKEEEKFNEKINTYKQAEENLKEAFENLANKIFDDKSEKLSDTSKEKIESLLDPFKTKINEFNQLIDNKFTKEAKDVASLREQIDMLMRQSKEIGEDANNLAKALTGQSKKIGNWGEDQLEKLFENIGLKKGIHYESQPHFSDENNKTLIPDYIIKLPDDKCLIIDSKVSIAAYERYYETDAEEEKEKYLAEHVASVLSHIKNLSSKNYQDIYEINQPDYVIMYIPIEPALFLAMDKDNGLYEKAYKENIILVSTSVLLATLKTISFIWKQENQKRYVMEIAKVGGELYDKFVGFISDMTELKKNLDRSSNFYEEAMKKLRDSPQKATTIIGRIEQLRELGAKTSKSLPQSLLDQNADARDTTVE